MSTEDKPIRLVAPALKPDQAVVGALRDWLSQAKAGRIRGVILLGVDCDGMTLSTSKGSVGYANAVFMAQGVITESMNDAKMNEQLMNWPDRPEGEDEDEDEDD